MSGTMFFFAFNWDELHKFIKLSLVLILIISTIVININSVKDSLLFNTTLWIAIVGIGIEFAIFGQIYQTGADAYNLFVAWSIFALGFVVVSSSSINWFTYLILLNTSIFLYIIQSLHINFTSTIAIKIVFNIFTLFILYFLVDIKKLLYFNWIYKVNYLYLILLLTGLLMTEVIDSFSFYSIFIIVYLALIYYNKGTNDIFTESLSILSLVFLISAFSSNIVPTGSGKVYFSILVFIIASVVAVQYITNKFKNENISLNFNKLPWMTHLFIFILSIFSAFAIILFGSLAGMLSTTENILFISLSIFIITLALRKEQHSSLNWYYGFLVAIILSQIGIFIGLSMLLTNDVVLIFNINVAFLTIAILQILLFIIIKDYINRILNIVVFCISIVFIQYGTISYFSVISLLLVLTFIITFTKYSKKDFYSFTKVIDDGIILSIFVLSSFIIFKDNTIFVNTLFFQIISSVLLLYVIYVSLKINNILSMKIMIFIIISVIATSYIPSLNSILLLLIISFHIRKKYLTIFSIIVAVTCVSFWYYNIELSLLYKSIYMICAGLSMMMSYYFINKKENLCEI